MEDEEGHREDRRVSQQEDDVFLESGGKREETLKSKYFLLIVWVSVVAVGV